jgi:CxxC-x17-CxxC domain-containing protein
MGFRDRDFGGRDRGRSRFNDRGRGDRRGGFGGRGRDSRRGFGDRERKPMVDVICDQCGKDCQVPFKPTGDKPVLCSECFEKKTSSRGSFGSSNSVGITKEQFNELNSKLDRVLEILENVEFEDVEEDEEDSEEEVK